MVILVCTCECDRRGPTPEYIPMAILVGSPFSSSRNLRLCTLSKFFGRCLQKAKTDCEHHCELGKIVVNHIKVLRLVPAESQCILWTLLSILLWTLLRALPNIFGRCLQEAIPSCEHCCDFFDQCCKHYQISSAGTCRKPSLVVNNVINKVNIVGHMVDGEVALLEANPSCQGFALGAHGSQDTCMHHQS